MNPYCDIKPARLQSNDLAMSSLLILGSTMFRSTMFHQGERAVALFCTDIAARGWHPSIESERRSTQMALLFSKLPGMMI